MTFNIPKGLRIYCRYGRKLLAHLYRVARESWSDYAAEKLPCGKYYCGK